jgi:hypothetical protein
MDKATVQGIMRQAHTAFMQGCADRLAELEKAGPKWAVKDGQTGQIVGTMTDVCGFAHIEFGGKTPLATALKTLLPRGTRSLKDGNGRESPWNNLPWYVGEGYPTGFYLGFRGNLRQEMSVAEAGMNAALAVLKSYGLGEHAYVTSRMD